MVKFRLTDRQRAMLGPVIRQANENYDRTHKPGFILIKPTTDSVTELCAVFIEPNVAAKVQEALGKSARIKEREAL